MKRIRRAFFAAVIAVSSAQALGSGAAFAQSTLSDADAERLFKEGQKLMEEKRFGEACPKFEAVYKKDNQLGTLLNLAYCHKEQGAIWLAWLEFKEAEIKAGELKRADRKEFARQRMSELEKSLARAAIEAQDKVDLTEVLIEDRKVPDAEKGTTFAAEPGQRKLTFRAKGKKPVTTMVTITKSPKAQKISVPDMEDAPKEPEPVAVDKDKDKDSSKDKAPSAVQAASSDGSTQRTVGIVLMGVGAVGVVVGSIAGLTTLGSDCANHAECSSTPEKRAQAEEAIQSGNIANIAFAVGGAGLIGGALLFFLAPRAASAPAQTGTGARRVGVVPELGAGWAGVRGRF